MLRHPGGKDARPGERVRVQESASAMAPTGKTADSSTETTSNPGAKRQEKTGVAGMKGVKHFVLDTNVLLHNPDALFVFQ